MCFQEDILLQVMLGACFKNMFDFSGEGVDGKSIRQLIPNNQILYSFSVSEIVSGID